MGLDLPEVADGSNLADFFCQPEASAFLASDSLDQPVLHLVKTLSDNKYFKRHLL